MGNKINLEEWELVLLIGVIVREMKSLEKSMVKLRDDNDLDEAERSIYLQIDDEIKRLSDIAAKISKASNKGGKVFSKHIDLLDRELYFNFIPPMQ